MASKTLTSSAARFLCRTPAARVTAPRFASSSTKLDAQQNVSKEEKPNAPQPQQGKKKTQAELDEELKMKMAGLSGDGGESGVEYEDGQPTSMKRSVRNNMFRYI